MTDEVLAPLIPIPEEEEKHNSSNANYDNELEYLLGNNIREEINNNYNNNNNIRNYFPFNFRFNNYHKKSLIFFSYAIEVLIYLILLEKYFDKIDFIKNNYNVLFLFSLLFIIIVLFIHIPMFNDIREMSIIIGLILFIISSIFMYLFLYKLTVIITLQVIKNIMSITILMYLYLSIVNLFFSFFEDIIENKPLFIYLSSWFIIFLLCFIFYKCDFINKEIALFSFCVACFLNIISTGHIKIIFMIFEVILKDYLIIHMSLSIDLALLSLLFFIISSDGRNIEKKRREIKYYN